MVLLLFIQALLLLLQDLLAFLQLVEKKGILLAQTTDNLVSCILSKASAYVPMCLCAYVPISM
jgi:hypothetical protein